MKCLFISRLPIYLLREFDSPQVLWVCREAFLMYHRMMDSLNAQRAQIVNELSSKLLPDDITPTVDFDIAPVYTLIAHLPDDIREHIHAVIDQIQTYFPEQYYYPPSEYHLTVVPVPHDLDVTQIIESVAPILANWRLPINVHGIVANRLQAGTILYPEEETLVHQRTRLRAALGIPEQAYTTHSPIWEELLWVNAMRFTTKPAEGLLELIQTHARDDLGDFTLEYYELYETSTKTLDPSSSTLLHTFRT